MERGIELLPGVRLTCVQTEKFKTGCFSVNLLRPLRRDEAGLNALLPNVLLRGTERHTSMQAISAHLDTLYGASMGTLVRKKGETQTTGFYADFLCDRLSPDGSPVLEPMIRFLGEVLLQPYLENDCFRRDFVEGEKQNLVNAIEASLNDKRSYAMQQLIQNMCRDEPYGVSRLGDAEQVRAITPQTLTAHWRRVLATSRIEIFYLGAQSAETVAALFREALGALPRGTLAETGTCVQTGADTARTVEQALDVTQAKLCLGLRTGCTCRDADYLALMLLNAVYGGGVSSKLFRNVREKRSLCYYVSSSVEKFKGVMVISSGIDEANYATARDEILLQLEQCRQGNITQEELNNARRRLLSAIRAQQDAPGGLDDFYIGQAIAGLDGTLEQLSADLQQVTVDQMVRAAQRLQLDTVYLLKGVQA